MSKHTRLIAVKYLNYTNTKGIRYKCSMSGHDAHTYGAGLFNDGRDDTLQAAELYFFATHPDAKCVEVRSIAHPIEDRPEYLFIVTYLGDR